MSKRERYIHNWLSGLRTKNIAVLARRMKDYATVGKQLLWQRQVIFLAALVLAGYYYSLRLALISAALVALSELYDYLVFRRILAWDGLNRRVARNFMNQLFVGTALSSLVIVFYAFAIAQVQGPGAHFMSLFFLFAAALFAAINNHQLLPVLVMRMAIYGTTFIIIPVWDIVVTGASIDSELWAQLFTSLFVLYFVVDCSRIYLSFYRNNFIQLERLKIENKKATQAYQAKSAFLSTMSHELRTPLTSIKGSIDLVQAGKLGAIPDSAEQVMTIAQRNCARLISLIDEILDLQKIESGLMSFEMDQVDVNQLVEQSLTLNEPYANQLDVRLCYFASAERIFVNGDKKRLSQVLTNIISNACKFSPPGSTVHIRTERLADRARISIVDQGVGLSEAARKTVFEKFSQLDASDTRRIGGTGLGMDISKQIMHAHEGVIDYFRNIDRGTTFYIEMDVSEDLSDILDIDTLEIAAQ